MKRWICVLLAVLLATVPAACGSMEGTAGRTTGQSAGVKDVIEAGMAEADGAKSDPQTADETEVADKAENQTPTEGETAVDGRTRGINENAPLPETVSEEGASEKTEEGIDIDLTTMSSTMVYSEVYSMLAEPEEYIGKTVKMNGVFALYHDETTGEYYFACIIRDATACCSQGIEFVLTEDYVYPDDYPEVGGDVTVRGVFDTYLEGDYMYCTLRNAVLV